MNKGKKHVLVNFCDFIMYSIIEAKIKALYLAEPFLLCWGQTLLIRKCQTVRGFSSISIFSMFTGHGKWIRFLPYKLVVEKGGQAEIEDYVDQQLHSSPALVGSWSFCFLLWTWYSSWAVEEGQTQNTWTHAQSPWTQMTQSALLWA